MGTMLRVETEATMPHMNKPLKKTMLDGSQINEK
jgi:hypothetical protein